VNAGILAFARPGFVIGARFVAAFVFDFAIATF